MAASDAIPVPRKNTAFRMTFPVYDTSGALKSSLASADSEVSLDGAAFADCTNEVTEIGSTGFYYIDLTSGEMNADTVAYKLTGTGINTLTAIIYPEEAGDYRAAVTSIGAGVITAASIDTGAIDADALAADAVTEIQSGLATAAALATVDGVVDSILLDTAEIGTAGAGLTALATAANLATVAGYLDTEIAAILSDTNAILVDTGTTLPATLSALPTATQNADALLNRDMSAVTDSNARTPINALRFLRNKYSISGTTLTVTKEDDATPAWTAVLTTSAGADPVVGSDPA